MRLVQGQPHHPLCHDLVAPRNPRYMHARPTSHVRAQHNPFLPQGLCGNQQLAGYDIRNQHGCKLDHLKLHTQARQHCSSIQPAFTAANRDSQVCFASQGMITPDTGSYVPSTEDKTKQTQQENQMLKTYSTTTAIGSLVIAITLFTSMIVMSFMAQLFQAMFQAMAIFFIPFLLLFPFSLVFLPFLALCFPAAPVRTPAVSSWWSWFNPAPPPPPPPASWLSSINPEWASSFFVTWAQASLGLAVILGVAFLFTAYIRMLTQAYQARSTSTPAMPQTIQISNSNSNPIQQDAGSTASPQTSSASSSQVDQSSTAKKYKSKRLRRRKFQTARDDSNAPVIEADSRRLDADELKQDQEVQLMRQELQQFDSTLAQTVARRRRDQARIESLGNSIELGNST